MRDFMKRALTRRIPVKGHRKQIELEQYLKRLQKNEKTEKINARITC